MVDKVVTFGRNVVDFLSYQQGRKASLQGRAAAAKPLVASANYCSHCGAWLAEGESEDDCSSAGFSCETV